MSLTVICLGSLSRLGIPRRDLRAFLLCFPLALEVTMIGDYPTGGWRLWTFIAGLVVVGLIGVVLMLVAGGDS
jgi:hypothetical protein